MQNTEICEGGKSRQNGGVGNGCDVAITEGKERPNEMLWGGDEGDPQRENRRGRWRGVGNALTEGGKW